MIAPQAPVAPAAPVAPVLAEPAAPHAEGGWATQLARLVRWELFLAWRRRAMMITLGALLLVGYLLIISVQYLIYFVSSADASGGGTATQTLGAGLRLPGSLGGGGSYVANGGLLLFVVLAGALIGSEYSYSTLRLSLARGVGRGTLLAAQVIALALLALGLTAGMLLLSALVGALGSALGLASAVPAGGGLVLGEIVVYWLALALNIWVYGLISVWIGTLSRSVAGAIAGPLVFLVIEVVTINLLTALQFAPFTSPLLKALGQIPNYLLGTNTNALMTLAGDGPYPFSSGRAPVGVAHALIVCLAYCALFIGVSYLALRNRDVTE